MTALPPLDAYRIWARTYDRSPNPLIALETRLLKHRLNGLSGKRIIDVGTGTGRWLKYAASQGSECFGTDICEDMLAEARASCVAQTFAVADACALPVHDDSFDISISSFLLSYIADPKRLFRELVRVARQVVVSDLHPEAAKLGWNRGFSVSGRSYRIASYRHSLAGIHAAARNAGLLPEWESHAPFGPEEFAIFQRAGKADRFLSISQTPAVLISAWKRA